MAVKGEEKDSSIKNYTGVRDLTPQRNCPPDSPFHGFASSRAPAGLGVTDGELGLSLRFPPRRLGWVTTEQRPICPAFPQVCRGGRHVHKGRSRFGERRRYAPAIKFPFLVPHVGDDNANVSLQLIPYPS